RIDTLRDPSGGGRKDRIRQVRGVGKNGMQKMRPAFAGIIHFLLSVLSLFFTCEPSVGGADFSAPFSFLGLRASLLPRT
ncbi:MAG: hypothetical protein QHC90_30795, partial [Shinella sp.]|nr:hypothetical protein [Shinella sp.]